MKSKRDFYNKKASGPGMARPSREWANPLKDHPELIKDTVFLIGNGVSRKDFDLERLRPHGLIIGCNALYREFTPDLLIVVDVKMITEITKSGYPENHYVIQPANRSKLVPNGLIWRCQSGGYNTSGCFGMRICNELIQAKKCYMLGMDGYDGNLYQGTENYGNNPIRDYTGIHKYYFNALSVDGPTIFYNVNPIDGWPKEMYNTGKYFHITYDEFENVLNEGDVAE